MLVVANHIKYIGLINFHDLCLKCIYLAVVTLTLETLLVETDKQTLQ